MFEEEAEEKTRFAQRERKKKPIRPGAIPASRGKCEAYRVSVPEGRGWVGGGSRGREFTPLTFSGVLRIAERRRGGGWVFWEAVSLHSQLSVPD